MGFCVLAFANHEKEGKLMMRSLYHVGALTVIMV